MWFYTKLNRKILDINENGNIMKKMEIKSKQINLKNDLIVLPYIEINFLTKDYHISLSSLIL
jgi:hypothetical protein